MTHAADFSEVLAELEARGLRLAIAESLTGGALSASIVDVPGASRVLLGAVVAYTNEVKVQVLGVDPDTLDTYGAVSAQMAGEMARGVKQLLASAAGIASGQVISIATTGVAGPDADGEHPVGEVFIAIDWNDEALEVQHVRLAGNRAAVRSGTVATVVELLRSLLAK